MEKAPPQKASPGKPPQSGTNHVTNSRNRDGVNLRTSEIGLGFEQNDVPLLRKDLIVKEGHLPDI